MVFSTQVLSDATLLIAIICNGGLRYITQPRLSILQ